MVQLAQRHCERGVRANEYGVVGDILFYSLQFCVDSDVYSRRSELAWIRIYSAMLRLILPVALQYENVGEFDSSKRTFAKLRENASCRNRLQCGSSLRYSSDICENGSFLESKDAEDAAADGDIFTAHSLAVLPEEN